MADSSWIKVFRSINTHWIWKNPEYLKWWLDILIEVNHTPSKTLINSKVYACERGEKLYSLDTWAKRWGTNKSKVRRFLELLQNDNMIRLKNEQKTTRLTVCNYDSYQDTRNADETQTKRKRNASETQVTPIEEGKEGKEGKEDRPPTAKQKSFKTLTEDEFKHSLVPFVQQFGKKTVREFFDYWTEKSPSGQMKFQLNKTWDSKKRLTTWKANESKYGNTPDKEKPKTIPAGPWNV